MNILDKWLPNMLSLLFVVVLALNFAPSCGVENGEPKSRIIQTVQKTDTVYVQQILRDTIRLIERQTIYKPKVVRVYLPDTARRKQMEHDTLMASLSLQGNALEVQQITPNGTSLLNQYRLPYRSPYQITMDYRGKLQLQEDPKILRQKKWEKRMRTASYFISAGTGFYLGTRFNP